MATTALPSYVSHSQLRAFSDCPAKFRLRYVDGVKGEPQGAFIGGSAIHRTIEESERQGWWADPENFQRNIAAPHGAALEFFREEYGRRLAEAGGPEAVRWAGRKSKEFPQGEDAAWWLKNGEFMLRRYADTRTSVLADFEFKGVEMKVTLTLPSGREVLGYIDAFLGDLAGAVLADWKTGVPGRAGPDQLAEYAVMVDGSPASELVGGEMVERGLIVDLRAADATRRHRWFNLAPLKPFVVERYEALNAMRDLGQFPPEPNAWHSSCYVREACDYWHALQAAEAAKGETP